MIEKTADDVKEWARTEFEDLVSKPSDEFSAGRGRTLYRLAKFLGIQKDLNSIESEYTLD